MNAEKRKKFSWAVMAIVLLSLTLSAESRIWTTRSGKKMEAAYVKQVDGTVAVKNADGKLFKISISKLSSEDQKHLKKLRPAPPGVETGDPAVVSRMVPGKVLNLKAPGKHAVTYHVYVPTTFASNAPPPMVIAFSPGGSGMQMLNALKSSAEKVGWVVVGCDKLKNGMVSEVAGQMEDEVLNDIYKKLPYDPKRIYLSGFSGGAMRSYSISARRKEKIAGIIAYGGWLGGGKHLNQSFCNNMAVAMINGSNDKGANCWVDKDKAVLVKHKCEVKKFSFTGGHGIAPAKVTDLCFTWLLDDWETRGSRLSAD